MGEVIDLRSYKNPCVYCFENKITQEKYIGATSDVARRYKEHTSIGKIQNSKSNLHKAIILYGLNQFSFKILEETEDLSKIADLELKWINEMNPEYNIKKYKTGSLGMKFSTESVLKLKEKGKISWGNKSEEEKSKIIKNNLTGPKKGYVMPEEQKQRLRELQKGKKWSEDQREKVSLAQKTSMKGNRNGNKEVSSIKDGAVVKTYPSAVEASKDFGIHPSCITGVLKVRRNRAGGYEWIYGKEIN